MNANTTTISRRHHHRRRHDNNVIIGQLLLSGVLLTLLIITSTNAFSIVSTSTKTSTTLSSTSSPSLSLQKQQQCYEISNNGPCTRLYASEDDKEEEEKEDETTEEGKTEEDTEDNDDEDEENTDDDEEDDDDEIKLIKNEINELEEKLKNKRNTIRYKQQEIDKYSKEGYARKVAEMENTKNLRRNLQKSNQYTSLANTISNFIPILNELNIINNKYTNDDESFGKQYSGIIGSFNTALKSMDVTDYIVNVGDKLDTTRMNVIDKEYSDTIDKDVVIRCCSTQENVVGMELNGNVIKQVDVIISLGSETETASATEEEETEETTTSEEGEQEDKESNDNDDDKKEKKKKVRSE